MRATLLALVALGALSLCLVSEAPPPPPALPVDPAPTSTARAARGRCLACHTEPELRELYAEQRRRERPLREEQYRQLQDGLLWWPQRSEPGVREAFEPPAASVH